jgi:type III pantothenate kinase
LERVARLPPANRGVQLPFEMYGYGMSADLLLAIDVGNTNISFWPFRRPAQAARRLADGDADAAAPRRIRRDPERAVPPRGHRSRTRQGGGVSSVVPPILAPIERLCRVHLNLTPLIVGPGTKTGVPVLYENPREVGATGSSTRSRRYDRWPQGAIVVDFGTATTFDVVTARGEYLGGVIAPGLTVSADALYHATAKLPRVEIARPPTAVGRNTVTSMQSGLVFGYAGLVDAIVGRIKAEVDFAPRVVGTGGLAPLIAAEARSIDECDDMLTLRGLAIIHDRNR